MQQHPTTTIPREILKWMQGLDLSYSIRDARRDLMNGFLLAEILSRYYPGKIYMHSLDNSSNKNKVVNNWQVLSQFFVKNELPFHRNEYEKIYLDSDFATLCEFISKVYGFLTQKKVMKPPLATYLQNTKDFYSVASEKNKQAAAAALGTSFILRDKGLEKLEDKKTFGNTEGLKTEEKENNTNKLLNETNLSEKPQNVTTNSPVKKTNFLRNFNKPISQNQDAGNLTIDVKNISIRQVNLNFSRLKEQQPGQLSVETVNNQNKTPPMKKDNKDRKSTNFLENKSAALNADDLIRAGTNTESLKSTLLAQKKEKPVEKTIFDALNEIISIRFSIQNYSEELKKIKVKNSTVLQAYCDNIEAFSDEFSSSFFEELLGQTEGLIKFVFKDQNELWKYLNFLFTCVKGLTIEGKAFRTLIEVLKVFGEKCLEYNPQNAFRTKAMFQHYYLPLLAAQIKIAPRFERKELLLRILYSFAANDQRSRFEMLQSYKQLLQSPVLYLQSLAILLVYESPRVSAEERVPIMDEAFKTSRIYMFSQSSNLCTMSLSILLRLFDLGYEEVGNIVEKNIRELSNSEWWESKILVIALFSRCIKSIIESDKYITLVKQNTSTHKSFSLENEQMIQKFQEKVGAFTKGIQTAALPPVNEHITRACFIYISGILGEHKGLMEIFIHLFLLANEETRKWVFYSKTSENELDKEDFLIESDRSLRFKVNIRSQDFEKHASNILIYIIEMIKELKNDQVMKMDRLTPEYMDILVYGFSFTDFKMINMELCESINNSIKEFIFIALCDDELCERARSIIEIMLRLQFFSEVKIKDSEKLLASAICLIYQNNFEPCKLNIQELLTKLMREAFDNAVDITKRFLLDVYKAIRQKTGEVYLKEGSSLGEILKPLEVFKEIEDKTDNKELEDEGISGEVKENNEEYSKENELPAEQDEEQDDEEALEEGDEEEYEEVAN